MPVLVCWFLVSDFLRFIDMILTRSVDYTSRLLCLDQFIFFLSPLHLSHQHLLLEMMFYYPLLTFPQLNSKLMQACWAPVIATFLVRGVVPLFFFPKVAVMRHSTSGVQHLGMMLDFQLLSGKRITAVSRQDFFSPFTSDWCLRPHLLALSLKTVIHNSCLFKIQGPLTAICTILSYTIN